MSISISALVVLFALASVAGWLFESVHSVLTTGYWEKRGFLFGPLCPIYGIGVVAAILVFDRPEVADGTFPVWAVFLASMVGSAVMEYTVSVALERMFGAVWWDYSNLPLNLNGRICLPASLLFGVAGLAVTYLFLPVIHDTYGIIPPIAIETAALVVAFVVAADLTMSVNSLSDLMDKIQKLDVSFHSRADEQVQRASSAMRALPEQMEASAQRRFDKTVATLTRHQMTLLRQLKKFSSAGVRAKAESLRAFIYSRANRNKSE